MTRPRFSIVIPTRDRAYTLAFTLKTCLAQQFDDYEIVVSDNFSAPDTRQVVEGCADRRLKYVRTSRSLAMTDSLEFALEHATGEYVIFVGSDDGLMLRVLPEIDKLIATLGAKALRWESAVYHWPDIAAQHTVLPDRLLIPLRMANTYYPVRVLESERMIRAAANMEVCYSELPLIYSSALHHSLVEQLRRQTGRVFRSEAPDVYASFAFAHAAGNYHSLRAPFGLCGLSGKSTGVACFYVKDKSPIAEQFRDENRRAAHQRHPWVPELSVMSAYVADSFLHAKEALFPHDEGLGLDRKRLVANCVREMMVQNEEEWRRVFEAVRRPLADDPAMLAWCDQEYRTPRVASEGRSIRAAARPRYGGTYLNLDTTDFGVTDVYGVAELCEKLLGFTEAALNIRLVEGGEGAEPLSELQEKEAMIQRMNGLMQEQSRVIQELQETLRTQKRPAVWLAKAIMNRLRSVPGQGWGRRAS